MHSCPLHCAPLLKGGDVAVGLYVISAGLLEEGSMGLAHTKCVFIYRGVLFWNALRHPEGLGPLVAPSLTLLE